MVTSKHENIAREAAADSVDREEADLQDLSLLSWSARSLLLTVIGEFVYTSPEGAWTTALLSVLGKLGVEEHAARQVLARAASAGWIERERDGRAVRWHLADKGRALTEDGIRHSNAYLYGSPGWAGHWLLLFVSVPTNQRKTRKHLYGGLSWLGMGNPMPGVWVTPHTDRREELITLIRELGLDASALVVVGSIENTGLNDREIVSRAWDLTDLAEHYERLLTRYDTAVEPVTDDEVLRAYLELIALQQRFMRLDPVLPESLLPDWIGRAGSAMFRTRRERWSATAHERWAQILQESEPT